jgi:hypothetical protein
MGDTQTVTLDEGMEHLQDVLEGLFSHLEAFQEWNARGDATELVPELPEVLQCPHAAQVAADLLALVAVNAGIPVPMLRALALNAFTLAVAEQQP